MTAFAREPLVIRLKRPARAVMCEFRRFFLQMTLFATHLRMTGIADAVKRLFAVTNFSRPFFSCVAGTATFGVMARGAVNTINFGMIFMVKRDDSAAAVGGVPDFFVGLHQS